MKSIIAALRRSENARRAVIARLMRRIQKTSPPPAKTLEIKRAARHTPRPRLQVALPAWVAFFFLKGW